MFYRDSYRTLEYFDLPIDRPLCAAFSDRPPIANKLSPFVAYKKRSPSPLTLRQNEGAEFGAGPMAKFQSEDREAIVLRVTPSQYDAYWRIVARRVQAKEFPAITIGSLGDIGITDGGMKVLLCAGLPSSQLDPLLAFLSSCEDEYLGAAK